MSAREKIWRGVGWKFKYTDPKLTLSDFDTGEVKKFGLLCYVISNAIILKIEVSCLAKRL